MQKKMSNVIFVVVILAVGFYLFSKLSNVQNENNEMKSDMSKIVNLFVKHTKTNNNAVVQKNKKDENVVVLPRKYDDDNSQARNYQQQQSRESIESVGPALKAKTSTGQQTGVQNSQDELAAMFE